MTATERDRLIIVEQDVKAINDKLDKVIEDHETRIRCLESKPSKRWDNLITIIITVVATNIITFLIARFS